MTVEYRGWLDPPLANAPTGLAEEVRRLLDYGGPALIATAVCDRNQHVLATVVAASSGPVVVWTSGARAVIDGRTVLSGGRWAATIHPPDRYPLCRARCRCSRATLDIARLIELAAVSPKRRVVASLLRPQA